MSGVDTTTEIWKAVPGCEGLYEVSTLGRMKRLAGRILASDGRMLPVRECILKPFSCGQEGYCGVKISVGGRKRNMYVHHAVMRTFVGPPPEGLEILHDNNSRTDCRLSNLHYGTKSENAQDRWRHGTIAIGERNPRAVMDEEKVLLMRSLYATGKHSTYALAARFGVQQMTAWKIVARKTWKHLVTP